MSSYVIFIREQTKDRSHLDHYRKAAQASLEGHPAALVAAYGRQIVLEGAGCEGVAMLEFPSFEEAKAWYDSPVYQKAREHRMRGAEYRAILVEGRSED